MAGIIITPGTFNPIAPPAQKMRLMEFPTVPDSTVQKPWMQWATRPTAPTLPPGTRITYASRYFVGGAFEIGVDADPFNAAISSLTTIGARYVPDGTYTGLSANPGTKRYGGTVAGTMEPGGVLDIGSVELTGAGGFNNIGVRIPYSLSLIGNSDGASYSLQVFNGPLDQPWSGFAETSVSLQEHANDLGSWIIDGETNLFFRVWRNGAIYEEIFLWIPTRFALTRVSGEPTSPRPVIDTSGVFADQFYGGSADATPVFPPGIPFSEYYRYSNAQQGRAVLS